MPTIKCHIFRRTIAICSNRHHNGHCPNCHYQPTTVSRNQSLADIITKFQTVLKPPNLKELLQQIPTSDNPDALEEFTDNLTFEWECGPNNPHIFYNSLATLALKMDSSWAQNHKLCIPFIEIADIWKEIHLKMGPLPENHGLDIKILDKFTHLVESVQSHFKQLGETLFKQSAKRLLEKRTQLFLAANLMEFLPNPSAHLDTAYSFMTAASRHSDNDENHHLKKTVDMLALAIASDSRAFKLSPGIFGLFIDSIVSTSTAPIPASNITKVILGEPNRWPSPSEFRLTLARLTQFVSKLNTSPELTGGFINFFYEYKTPELIKECRATPQLSARLMDHFPRLGESLQSVYLALILDVIPNDHCKLDEIYSSLFNLESEVQDPFKNRIDRIMASRIADLTDTRSITSPGTHYPITQYMSRHCSQSVGHPFSATEMASLVAIFEKIQICPNVVHALAVDTFAHELPIPAYLALSIRTHWERLEHPLNKDQKILTSTYLGKMAPYLSPLQFSNFLKQIKDPQEIISQIQIMESECEKYNIPPHLSIHYYEKRPELAIQLSQLSAPVRSTIVEIAIKHSVTRPETWATFLPALHHLSVTSESSAQLIPRHLPALCDAWLNAPQHRSQAFNALIENSLLTHPSPVVGLVALMNDIALPPQLEHQVVKHYLPKPHRNDDATMAIFYATGKFEPHQLHQLPSASWDTIYSAGSSFSPKGLHLLQTLVAFTQKNHNLWRNTVELARKIIGRNNATQINELVSVIFKMPLPTEYNELFFKTFGTIQPTNRSGFIGTIVNLPDANLTTVAQILGLPQFLPHLENQISTASFAQLTQPVGGLLLQLMKNLPPQRQETIGKALLRTLATEFIGSKDGRRGAGNTMVQRLPFEFWRIVENALLDPTHSHYWEGNYFSIRAPEKISSSVWRILK